MVEGVAVTDDGKVAVAFTVILFVTDCEQLLAFVTEYVIVTEPAETPDTTPEEFTVAMPVFDELHVPPDVLFVSVVVFPTQTLPEPDIAATDGKLLTVTVTDAQPEL